MSKRGSGGGVQEDDGEVNSRSKKQRNAQRRRDHQSLINLNGIETEVKGIENGEEVSHRNVMEIMSKLNQESQNSSKCSTKVLHKDAAICVRTGQLAVKVSRDASLGSQQFRASDFISKVLQKYGEEMVAEDGEGAMHIDWERMRIDAAPYFCAAPSCPFLATEMARDMKPKERKARQANQRRNVEETAPTYGQAEDDKQKNNSEKRKFQLNRKLAEDDSIAFIDMVCNPKSFGETVENMFACTCLVSEGEAALEQDTDGTMMLKKVEPPADKDKDTVTQKRCIIKFDVEMFKKLVQDRELRRSHYTFNPDEEEASIPTWNDEDDEDERVNTDSHYSKKQTQERRREGGAPGGVHGLRGGKRGNEK